MEKQLQDVEHRPSHIDVHFPNVAKLYLGHPKECKTNKTERDFF